MVLAFKYGKLVNKYINAEQASKKTGVPVEKIKSYLATGKQGYDGFSFDIPLDDIDYNGWGYEDEREIAM